MTNIFRRLFFTDQTTFLPIFNYIIGPVFSMFANSYQVLFAFSMKSKLSAKSKQVYNPSLVIKISSNLSKKIIKSQSKKKSQPQKVEG